MNKNTELYYQHALKLCLPASYDFFSETLEISLGKKSYFFFRSVTPLNTYTSATISKNKFTTAVALKKAGFPVPKTTALSNSEFQNGDLEEVISELQFPLVVKPLDGGLGEDVVCNIQNMQQLENHLKNQFLKYDLVLIQEFHDKLQSYRVLVLNNKIIGVVLRHPAHVLGDGQHTLQELIDISNLERKKFDNGLGPICIDFECTICLSELGIDLNYIPANGEKVSLGYTSNASRGGTYVSLGKKMCKKNKIFFTRASKVLDLDMVGFDVQCTDINVSIEQSEGVIIEANHGPSVRIHEKPMAGVRVSVCKKVLRTLIYRHPLAYMITLYQKVQHTFYFRSTIVLVLFFVIYRIIRL